MNKREEYQLNKLAELLTKGLDTLANKCIEKPGNYAIPICDIDGDEISFQLQLHLVKSNDLRISEGKILAIVERDVNIVKSN